MSETELAARSTRRLIWAALCLGLLSSGAVIATLRADAQTQAHAGPGTAAPPAAQPAGAPPQPGGNAPVVKPGARILDTPIPDDPTVAPDPHESADNNVSFPTDI